jgi:3-methyladenine DNA glycosylase/8-oxoguanine DNA glycosylase
VKDDEYVGVVANLLIRMRSNQDDQIEYEVLNDYEEVEYVRYPAVEKQSKQKRLASALSHYFRLDESLPGLIEFWRKRDQYFNEVGTQIHGLRMLR